MAQVHGIRFGVSSDESYDADQGRVIASHQATYVVEMDTESQRESTVARVAGVPYIGMPSPILLGAICTKRGIREVGPKTFEVDATFSNDVGSATEPDNGNPWDRVPEWSWSFETRDKVLTADAQLGSKAIANSAGELLEPVTVQEALPVLTIKRYELRFDGQTILDYVNKVNSSSFWGAAAGKALMAGINASPKQLDGTRVWQVQYQIKFAIGADGWKLKLLDQGSYYWSGAVNASDKLHFVDDQFNRVTGNLDGSGNESTSSTPTFVQFNQYDDTNFNDLNLGPYG